MNVKIGDCIIFWHTMDRFTITAIECCAGGSVYARCNDGYCMKIGSNSETYEVLSFTL